jgi:error-prone DNA polymerase
LSLAGALNFEGTLHRREALWQSEIAIRPAGELFDSTSLTVREGSHYDETGALPNGQASATPSFLKRMEGIDLIDADLRKTGISIGKHPMAFFREELRRNNILSAEESRTLKPGDIVSVAGAVIIRQRPATSRNVVFMTLEDETGHSNFVVMPDTFERFRKEINQNDYLIIRGIFEERGMIKALYFKPITEITTEVVSHNFR